MNFDGGTVRYNIEVGGVEEFKTSLEEVSSEFDRLTDKIGEVELSGKNLKDLQDTVDNLQFLMKKLDGLEVGTEEYDSALMSANEELRHFADLLGETGNAAEEAETPMKSLSQAIAEMAGNAGLAALKGVATGATTALVGLAKKGIATTNFLETSQVAMGGLLGSMERGTKALSVAADYWQNNPFQRTDVTSATKTLVQYGRTVDQLSGDLKILGNVSLSTGMSIDQLSLYYGRVASSGRAMTRDIEMMSQRGVPIYRELSKIMGATTEEVRKFAAEGKISFEIFKEAMEGAIDEEAMKAYENTLARQTDRLKGSIAILAGDLAGYKIVNDELQISAEGLYSYWAKLINTLATGLRDSKLRDGLTKIGEAIGNLLDKVFKFYEVWDEKSQKMVQHSATLEKVFSTLGKVVNYLGENAELLIPIALTGLGVVSKLLSQVPILGNAFGGLSKGLSGLSNIAKGLIQSHPLLAALIGLFTVGFVQAYKSSETFRNSIKNLFANLSKVVQNLVPLLGRLVQVFVDLASSNAVLFILQSVAVVLEFISGILASLPTEAFTVLFGIILAVKLSTFSPWVYWATVLGLIYSWISAIIKRAGGLAKVVDDIGQWIHQTFTSIGEFLRGLNLQNIGQNFIAGFFKGAREALDTGKSVIYSSFSGLITGIKNIFGIHSPSKVMYGIGQNVGLGLANGIEDSNNVVQRAMNNLASDTLKEAQKVIGNMSDFGLIDVNGTYKQWKKVANLFTVGSEQYQAAIEKMEDARKQVNLQIINLQNEYNNTLDETIKKIQSMYGLFDDVSTKGGKSASQIIKNLDKQVAQTEEWAEAQKIIRSSGLDKGLIAELSEMGVGSVSELSSIANMATSELEQLNELWLKKQAVATDAATDQLSDYKDDVLNQISGLADGIDGETVKVEDVGGRLVSSISEGIVGSLPTLDSAFGQLEDYIAEARKELANSVGGALSSSLPDFDDGGGDDNNKDKNPLEELKTDLESLGNTGLWVAGVLAGFKGLQWLNKTFDITGKLGSKLGGLGKDGGLLSKVGGLFGKKGSTAIDAQGMGWRDLSGLNKSTSQLGETSKGLSKANEWAKTIAKGALAIAAIAVAIAAIAGAIWVIDNALAGIEWGTFLSKLGMVAVATVVMGALSVAMGKAVENLGTDLLLGILAIAGVAGEIALLGLALGLMANSIPDDIGNVQLKMLLMYEAIVVMAVLAALVGAVMTTGVGAVAIVAGLLAIAGIAGDIALVGLSLGAMANAIPDDVSLVQAKLLLVYEAVGAFELLTAVAGIGALFEGLGILVIVGIAEDIKQVSQAIWLMSLFIPDDLVKVQAKLDMLKSVISQMSEANLGSVFKNVVQSARIATLKPTIDAFVEIGASMKRLEDINVSEDDVFGIMKALETIINSQDTLANFSQLGYNTAVSIRSGIYEGQGVLIEAGNFIQGTIWETIQTKMADEYYQGRALGEVFRQGLYDIDYGNAGWWAVQGFINGAKNRAYGNEGVYHTGWWVADTFLRGLQDRGEQGSPWKTTMQSGVWAAQGLIDGLESMEDKVIDEAEILADGVINAFSGTSLSPELNMSGSATLAPSMMDGVAYGQGVVVNQTNNNYTEYDVEQNLRDLSYELSKV